MTTEATMTDIDVTDNLDDVAAEMFGTPKVEEVVETPVEQEEAVTEQEAAAEGEAESADTEQEQEETAEEKAKKDEKSVNRFTKQTRELRETQRQLRELQAQLESLKKPVEQPLTQDKGADTNKAVEAPDPAKYQYGELDPQYIKDTARHEAKLMLEAALAERERAEESKRREADAQREADTLRTTAAKIEQAGSSKYPDFHEKVVEGGQAGEYPLTKEMFELAAETGDYAHDILYHLASNPEEAAKVAEMPFKQQALWFGRMEAKFTAPPVVQPRKATAAPPPPSASARGGASKGGPRLDDLDDPRALDAIEAMLKKGR